ncbi:MAG: hypothetical protein SWO11_12225 [Thermodesulfobacteriota bacterium]|nr:hypothetical protein [Thermodesulfobacteriota bacterium]
MVDAPDKDQEVVVFVTKYGFVSVFKEVTSAIVSAVAVLGLPRKHALSRSSLNMSALLIPCTIM